MKNRPKLELHLHLEGAASPAFIKGLAAEKKLDISGIFDERGNYAYADFAGFLDVYEAATQALKTPEDYARLTTAVLQDCAEHGVVYAETFLSPDFCGGVMWARGANTLPQSKKPPPRWSRTSPCAAASRPSAISVPKNPAKRPFVRLKLRVTSSQGLASQGQKPLAHRAILRGLLTARAKRGLA